MAPFLGTMWPSICAIDRPLASRPFLAMFMAMKRPDPLFKLRLPDEVRAPLEAAAISNNRSLTAEILERVRSSIETERQNLDPGEDPLVKSLQEELGFYRKNIRLYSAAASILAMVVKRARLLISNNSSVLPAVDVAEWNGFNSAIAQLVEVSASLNVTNEPADEKRLTDLANFTLPSHLTDPNSVSPAEQELQASAPPDREVPTRPKRKINLRRPTPK